jgi:uncharacterized protein
MSAFVIDAFEFCRHKGHREGVTPVADMARFKNDCADDSGEVSWSVQGGAHPSGHPQITLSVGGKVNLVCQRCLQPFGFEMTSSTVLVLGQSDAHADGIEEELDDETIDVIVGSRECDIRDLIEDEALLALPSVPKHDKCPDTGLLDSLKDEKPSPFAGLKNLKT